MNFYAASDTGKKYKHNEDRFVLPEVNEKYGIKKIDADNFGWLFCLCDGMGGANSGEIAAELSAGWIFKEYYSAEQIPIQPLDFINKIIIETNQKIFKLASEYEQYEGMGCTLIAALFLKEKLYIASLGDSRMYVFRNGQLEQLTEDQSEVWELYKKGAISKDDIRNYPRNHIITGAIGVKKELTVTDINNYNFNIKPEDLFLICSDGLTDMISEKEITNILIEEKDIKVKANSLIKAANNAGGKDNITVILAQGA